MAKVIEVPGQGMVEFPDSMTDDQIVEVIKKNSTAPQKPSGTSPRIAPSSTPQDDFRMQYIKNYAAETDQLLGLTPGTSLAQLTKESTLSDNAISKAGARGLAQIMPDTLKGFEKRFGRRFDPHKTEDALFLHREAMRENMRQFKNEDDALRAYNGGWDKNRWGNPETSNYVPAIRAIQNGQPVPKAGYQPYAPVRQKIDIKSLNKDPDWINASLLMYDLFERKPFDGTPDEAAEYGKNGIWGTMNDMTLLAVNAHRVATSGTQEQKEAFLYMLDTFDNTDPSWEGFRRSVYHNITDPTNVIGVGTLGVATVGKFVGRRAAIAGAKEVVKKSLGKALTESFARTGIAAGIDTGIATAAADATRQGLEIDAGRREERDWGRTAAEGGIGFVGGAALGTAADVALAKIIRTIRGEPDVPTPKGRVEPTLNPEARVETPAAPKESVVNPQAREVQAPESPLPKVANDNAPAGRDPNLGSTLTPAELKEAQARRQAGRLPEDEVVPPVPKDTPKIDVPYANTGLRDSPKNLDAQGQQAQVVVDQLREIPTKDLPAAMEVIRNGNWNSLPGSNKLEEVSLVSRAMTDYAKELKVELAEVIKKLGKEQDPVAIQQLQARVAELEARDSAILADDALGTYAGQLLRQRQEALPNMTGITPETIMKEQKVTKEQAQEIWADMVTKAEQTAEARKIADAYDARAEQAIARGDYQEAAMLGLQKRKELVAMGEQLAPGSARLDAKATELAISNVFTPKTLEVNIIPSAVQTLVMPGLKAILSNPFEKATRAEMAAAYSAMASMARPALQAAGLAARYEQALLTRGTTRLMEGELAIKGRTGGIIRTIPRLLNASDEFLSRINYAAFVSGKAAAEAAIAGAEKGMKGKELNDFIKRESKKALDASIKPTKGDDLVMPIINKGQNLGLTGDDLWKWVEKEIAGDSGLLTKLGFKGNLEALGKATDEEALQFVKDTLYKREFSGNNFLSKAAKAYEEGMNKFPVLKLVIGQLFFRTPVRVFEMGGRLTPGLQILVPNFVDDLKGLNGPLRQVRAQAEAMTSLAITAAVLSAYGQGRVTGDLAYEDWKQGRHHGNGPAQPEYTFKFDDGSTWSYRNMDPIATPIKIIVNGLERLDRLRIKEAQGEFIDKDKYDKAMAYVIVGTTAIAAAIRDANLTEGVSQIYELAQNFSDPEKHDTAILKWVADKLKLAVPNTLTKIAQQNDPRIKDPVTFWQLVEQRLAVPLGIEMDDVKTPYSYDILGNKRRLADTGALWSSFSTATVEERIRGMSPEAQAVMLEMNRLERVTGTVYKPPTKIAALGDTDLRTILASDGKRTLYDVWQENYRAMEPEKILYPYAVSELPSGTYKEKGLKVDAIQRKVNEMQDIAFKQLLSQEQEVINRYIATKLYKATAKVGQFDVQQ